MFLDPISTPIPDIAISKILGISLEQLLDLVRAGTMKRSAPNELELISEHASSNMLDIVEAHCRISLSRSSMTEDDLQKISYYVDELIDGSEIEFSSEVNFHISKADEIDLHNEVKISWVTCNIRLKQWIANTKQNYPPLGKFLNKSIDIQEQGTQKEH